jgi:uncharacterized SAM-binding protein YcdF (DUF218 family)
MMDEVLRQVLLLLQPIGFTWATLVVLTFLAWRRRQKLLGSMSTLLVVLLFLGGSTDIPGWLLRRLEKPWTGFQPAALPACDAVVVLGGGVEPSRFEAHGAHLTRAGDRLMMGLELMRLGKAPVLVLGGGAAHFPEVTKVEADVVKEWLGKWQPPGLQETVSLGFCANTRDEAQKVAALAKERGWKQIALVTSANHMTRAAAVFREAGVVIEPAPCNFLTTLSTAPGPMRVSIPGPAGFQKIQIWLHETVGWYAYQRRGWVK